MSSGKSPSGLSRTQQKKLRREARSLAREGKGVVRNGEFHSNEPDWTVHHDVWRSVVRHCDYNTLLILRFVNSFFWNLLRRMIVTRNIYYQICPFVDENVMKNLDVGRRGLVPWRPQKVTDVIVIDDLRIQTQKLKKLTTPCPHCKCRHKSEIQFFFGSDSSNYYTWIGCRGCAVGYGPQFV